jgi:hypothetical protein
MSVQTPESGAPGPPKVMNIVRRTYQYTALLGFNPIPVLRMGFKM